MWTLGGSSNGLKDWVSPTHRKGLNWGSQFWTLVLAQHWSIVGFYRVKQQIGPLLWLSVSSREKLRPVLTSNIVAKEINLGCQGQNLVWTLLVLWYDWKTIMVIDSLSQSCPKKSGTQMIFCQGFCSHLCHFLPWFVPAETCLGAGSVRLWHLDNDLFLGEGRLSCA